MMQKEKTLLLQDLCARLPYNLYVRVEEFNVPKNEAITEGFVGNYLKDNRCNDYDADDILNEFADGSIDIKPYLRPMSSMTEEEKEELLNLLFDKEAKYFYIDKEGFIDGKTSDLMKNGLNYPSFCPINIVLYTDWLNSHHFDYRNLIEKGLALEAPNGMYNIKGK